MYDGSQLFTWLDSKTEVVTCPVCQHREFDGIPQFVTMPMKNEGDIVNPQVSEKSMVFTLLICRHCAHTMFFDAHQMGLV